MSDFAEGQTATNPQTGAKVVWRSGSWHNATAADNTNTDTIVKALVDGRMSFPTDSRALNKPYWQNLMSKVSERDPTFDTIDYKARARTRQDFTSGKSAQNITSFNTLLHHIGTLQKAADALDNYGGVGTPFNAPANYLLEAGGSDRPTNFRQAKLAVVSEAVRAFRGVGGARGDIEEAAEAIPENGSPEQIRGSIKTLASLLEGRIKSLGEQYSAGMGKTSNGINLLDADARKTLAQLGIGQPEDEDRAAGVANGGAGPTLSAEAVGTPPTFDGGSSALVRGDQMPQQVGTPVADYTPEQRAAIAAVARTGTGDQLKALLTSFGRAFTGTDQDLDKILAYYKDPKNAARAVNLPETNNTIQLNDVERKEVADFVAGSDATGASVAGVANGTSLSFLDEAGAVAEAAFGSGEGSFVDRYGRRLAVNRAKLGGLEDEHTAPFRIGEVLGSLPLGFGEFTGAQEAAKAAGLAAVRRGVPVAEARVLSNRVLAARNALEAAGLSGVYAAGDSDGGIGDRLSAGAMGAVVGGVTGGTMTLAGGRFARALAARRAARVAARPASDDAFRRAASAGEPGNEAAQMLALAQQQGVRVLPQDIAEGPMIGRMTAGAAQSPFGTNTIRRATDDLYNSFSRRVDEVGGEAGSAPDVGGVVKARSAELAAREGQRAEATSGAVLREAGDAQDVTGAGIVAQRGATRWMEQTAERANALYARVPIQPEAPAALDGTRAALRELNEGMRSNPELGALFSNPRLQALERAVTDDVDPNTGEVLREARLSWRDLQEFRTRVGDALDDPRLSEKIASRQLRRLYGALSEDMRATAEAQGPDALRAWRRANDYYDGRMKRVNQTLSAVLGERRDRTPSEAMNALNSMLREGSTGDAARFSRVLRSMEPADARVVRATIVQEARGGRRFDAKELANNWEKLSERGKSALLPQPGLRSIMDDAADRAVASQRDPLAAKSGEQVVAALEAMAKSTGDSVAFRRQLAALSPDEAQSVRALLVNRMGLTKADAVRQGDGGEVFSISHFLSTWEKMTPEAKLALFGSGETRGNMDALATLAKRVQGSEALRGHSNTGAVNNLNATTSGLGGAAVALMTGHPIIAAGLAAPAAYQRLSAEALTSQRLLNWLAKAPKKPNLAAQRAHIAALSSVARAEPAIANDVLALQQRLAEAFGGGVGAAPTRLAAQEAPNEPRHEAPVADRQDRQGAAPYQGFQPR